MHGRLVSSITCNSLEANWKNLEIKPPRQNYLKSWKTITILHTDSNLEKLSTE